MGQQSNETQKKGQYNSGFKGSQIFSCSNYFNSTFI